ncbi:unnamed protein product [Ambrosiozyma monospora]|uniref:Unnamed protein product n=1 Tax=Ambrosiozyma monospora TaxID=43982 RepID=A0ACB5T7T2_AMBMO|nr:unnamed protein product [Ambrosiozyma monospora]
MGILAEIEKAWLAIENKLIIWNYKAAAHEQEYFAIDEFKHPILTVKLVKPKPKVFVRSVNYLLVVATSMDIHILAVEAGKTKLEIADTKMSVPTQGLLVNKFVTFDKTNEILFTGVGDSDNIWKLSYSNTDEWFHRNCSKECLTKSNFVNNVIPGYTILQKIPGFSMLTNDSSDKSKLETTIELKIDQSRNILYTLSSKSIMKAYKLKIENGKVVLGAKLTKRPIDLLKDLSTTAFNLQSPLLAKNQLKIVNIFPISKAENSNLFLIAVTNSGCRLFINGSTMYGERLALTTSYVKYPPPDSKFTERVEELKQRQIQREQEFLHSGVINSNGIGGSVTKGPIAPTITINDVKQAQESSQLLSNLKHSVIISPGIFIGYISSKTVFTCAPDYGILKKSEQCVEDFETIDDIPGVHSIVQLGPTFNPVNRPRGYCNAFASQYTAKPLEFAVLTSAGIQVYRYRTPDLILEDSLDDKTFAEFSDKYGSEEACSTSLYLACKYGKPDSFKNLATQFFVSGGKNAKLNKNLHAMIDNVELSDRFYATVILISRLVRNFWNKEAFKFTSGVNQTWSTSFAHY